jgi:serine/threonine protein kinase
MVEGNLFSLTIILGSSFIVDHHYTVIKKIGSGAYGNVCSVLDSRTNKKVAIKQVKILMVKYIGMQNL